VPGPTVVEGKDKLSKFFNAHHYTDASVGRFIEQARREPWWERTLIIITADHGHRLPVPDEGSAFEIYERAYRIPMLWLGGAVARPGLVVSQLGVQTDLPRTLLAQLGLSGRHYRWAWDLLAPGARPFAYYSFNGGFAYLTDRGGFLFDMAGQRIVSEGGAVTEHDRRSGLAFAQVVYQDSLDQ
jgi:arylsulfatase A-like enzyme